MRIEYILAILAVAIALVFWPVLGHDFVGIDDDVMIAHNPDLNPPSVSGVLRYWRAPARALYMPVTYTAWAAAAAMSDDSSPGAEKKDGGAGLPPAWFHALSLVVHVATAACVFALLEQLTGNTRASLFGALLFALHPLQVESVAWAAEAKDLLAGLFAVGALWQYVRFVRISADEPKDAGAWIHYLAATVLFILAMLSKPSAVAVPLLAGVLDVAWLRRAGRDVAMSLWPWLALTIPIILLGHDAQQGTFEPIAGVARTNPLWWRPIIALDSVGFYLAKVIAPLNLGIDYGRSPWQVMSGQTVWLSVGITIVIAAMLSIWRRKLTGLSIGILLMAAALVPTLGLVSFDFQEKSTVADHYMYLAMIGPALVGAWWMTRWPGRATVTTALLILAIFGVRSRLQTAQWRDGETCYRHGLAVNPQSWWLADILGYQLLMHDHAADAIPYCRQSVELAPRYAAAHAHLGVALAETGKFAEAAEHLQTSLAIDPKRPRERMILGDIHMLRSQYDQALTQYKAAKELDPNLPGLEDRLQRARQAARE